MTSLLLLTTLAATPPPTEAPYEPASSTEIQAFLQSKHVKQKPGGGKVTYSCGNFGTGTNRMWLVGALDVSGSGATFYTNMNSSLGAAHVYYEPKSIGSSHLVIATVYAQMNCELLLSDNVTNQNSTVSVRAGHSGHLMFIEPAGSRALAIDLTPASRKWQYVFKDISIQELH